MVATSFQRNKSSTKLFKKGKKSTGAFVLTMVLAMGCIFIDYHYAYLHPLRSFFVFLISPLQYAVDYPVRVVGRAQSLLRSQRSLMNENIKLQYQQTLMQAQLQKWMALKEENLQLKELLLTSSRSKVKAMAAEILAVDASAVRQLLVLNKGKRDGIYIGQPVLDAKGVLGQIIDIGYMTSTVLLISDSKSAVPVRNNRTGECAILIGGNHASQLSLINLPNTSSIQKGDLLVTSGLGKLYPEGYPVGSVTKVENIPGEAFVKVDVTPIALLNRNRLVLLIWTDKERQQWVKEIEVRMRAKGEFT